MYAAKEAGKNCYKFFDHSLRDLAIERSRIEEDLRIAIAEEALTLQFQPKVDVGTMEVRGVEALVRWHHPVRGNIPPDDFIGIAEQRGLMPELGNCVMNMAVKQARKWLDEGRPTRIAVNVSAAQFERAQLVPEILSALERHKVDPALIEIEITETMVMSDFARTHERMQRLREVGVRISIDDFGTGFSNLSQLARLPFSILKIDRSLIADIGQNPKSEAIIKAIVSMAHALGHEVIAEGIEQVEQYAFLRRLGCDQAQGFLFGTPMLASEFPGWVDNLGQSEVASQLNDLKMRLAVG
jgi:two-component system CheB/CheR fusion protein